MCTVIDVFIPNCDTEWRVFGVPSGCETGWYHYYFRLHEPKRVISLLLSRCE
jgi:hypothetical protein